MKKILGYDIFGRNINKLMEYLTSDKIKKIHIVSGNPEVLYRGFYHKELFDNFTSKASIIIPDGIGVLLAAKIKNIKIEEKIAGIEVFLKLLEYARQKKKNVYLLGATEETVKESVKVLENKIKGLNIVGFKDGFFDIESCNDIIDDINEKKTDFLFVAMGAPRQEKFITKYFDDLNCKILMGVGGSFDVVAGKVNRAPRLMIKLGLEWLYRVVKEPFRIKRLLVIPKFLIKVIREK